MSFYLRDGVPMITWEGALATLLANDRPIRIVGQLCSSNGCVAYAVARTHWPSSDGPQVKCSACTEKLRRVADAMGFVLHVDRVPMPTELPDDPSAQRFALMELD